MLIRRYHIVLLSSLSLLSGASVPAQWERPAFVPSSLPRPVVPLTPYLRSIPSPQKINYLTKPSIALTFDDGPHPIMTERLLAVLRQNNVHCTFFIVGKMGERFPGLVRAIARDGHEIASHTYNHPNLITLSDESVLHELYATRRLIRDLTGFDTMYFRPPGGQYDSRTLGLAEAAGYRMVLWSIVSNDVRGDTPRTMRHRILKEASDGSVVLMHSGIPSTLEILPDLIQELRRRGYRFVRISDLTGIPAPTYNQSLLLGSDDTVAQSEPPVEAGPSFEL